MGGPGWSFWRGAAEGTARRAPREGVLRGPREEVGAPVLRPPPEAHACLSPGPPPPGGSILGRGRVAAVWMEASTGQYRCRDTEGLCRCQQWPHRPSRREPLGTQRQTCRPWRGSGPRLPGPTSPRGPWKWHSQHLCTVVGTPRGRVTLTSAPSSRGLLRVQTPPSKNTRRGTRASLASRFPALQLCLLKPRLLIGFRSEIPAMTACPWRGPAGHRPSSRPHAGSTRPWGATQLASCGPPA
ncbi:tektin bundle-interacting protein 1 isoform X3 [Acinonyx jubatus]|uniref:Tektin bundle-interacting protein 1 isoform X3 n=1 Tax=Acinonyx jubatus TaxID=32536 RepID=A0ABM3PWQ1_ACIJB|nr:tektin bundle-interacting protein 1 isoform X3 [Acinonyx jubatus]